MDINGALRIVERLENQMVTEVQIQNVQINAKLIMV